MSWTKVLDKVTFWQVFLPSFGQKVDKMGDKMFKMNAHVKLCEKVFFVERTNQAQNNFKYYRITWS